MSPTQNLVPLLRLVMPHAYQGSMETCVTHIVRPQGRDRRGLSLRGPLLGQGAWGMTLTGTQRSDPRAQMWGVRGSGRRVASRLSAARHPQCGARVFITRATHLRLPGQREGGRESRLCRVRGITAAGLGVGERPTKGMAAFPCRPWESYLLELSSTEMLKRL